MFVPGKPFESSQMFAGKSSRILNVDSLKGAPLEKAPALLANIRLGWKSLPGTNTLAYYKKS